MHVSGALLATKKHRGDSEGETCLGIHLKGCRSRPAPTSLAPLSMCRAMGWPSVARQSAWHCASTEIKCVKMYRFKLALGDPVPVFATVKELGVNIP